MINFLSSTNSVGLDLVRTISATFDKAIYSIISFVYEIILEIANISVFDPETIGSFSDRIYTLIGIFMLFKLSFSLITYIINPDSVFDKEKGGTKLIKNIVISFILIIMMPTFFTIMNEVQNAILTDHVIENFIFGNDKNDTHNKFLMDERCYDKSRNITGREITKEGDYIALLIFRPFFQMDPNGATIRENIGIFRESYYCNTTTVSDVLQSGIYNSPNSASLGSEVDGVYDVDYWYIISTLVGGVVAVILVGFAMDVAVRSIKIAFLQIVSPIAIISYIDPSQSKNGMLMKWAKELGKTWADLFIRLIALYLVILIVTMIDTTDMLKNVSSDYKIWVTILIIIGGLIFAKKLPSLIGNLLGIKLDGGFTINPMKKIRDQALLGNLAAGAITGGVAAGGAMVAGGIANAYAAKKKIDKITPEEWSKMSVKQGMLTFASVPLSALGGAGSSAMRTLYNSKDGKFTPLKNIEKGVTASSKARESRADGWGFVNNTVDRVATMSQVKLSTGDASRRDNEIKKLQMELENYKRDENTAAMGMTNILSSNGGVKASLYQDAFKNKVIDEDGTFKYGRATPDNYFEWAAGKGFDAQTKWNEIENDFRSMGASADDLERLTRDSFDHYVQATYGNSMLTRNEYENYGSLFDARNTADFEGRKTEKAIKKKQENKPNSDKK